MQSPLKRMRHLEVAKTEGWKADDFFMAAEKNKNMHTLITLNHRSASGQTYLSIVIIFMHTTIL